MLLKNLKRSLISLLLTSALLLSCGCQTAENDPQISDINTSAPTQNTENKNEPQLSDTDTSAPALNTENTDDPVSTDPDNSSTTESQPAADPAETTEQNSGTGPDDWISLHSDISLIVRYNSIIDIDCSIGEMSDIAYALACKNALYVLTYWGTTFRADWDYPVTYGEGEDELTLYPVISVLFPDVKSVYELAYSTYGVNDEIYTFDADTNSFYSRGRLFFTEIDGKLYVNLDCTTKKGAAQPFLDESYIEIREQTEDTCKLSWYYYDRDKWGGTDELYKHIYFKHPKAIFVDGAWILDDVFENTI